MSPSRALHTELHIDWARCRGRALCIELLPELLDRDDWGYPLARAGDTTNLAVPPRLVAHAERAIRDCPLAALHWR